MMIQRWLLIGSIALLLGCVPSFVRNKSQDNFKPDDIVPADQPSAKELVRYLNDQSALIDTFHAKDISVDARVNGESTPDVSGWLICQKPLNFRLTAKFLGMSQIDFGSNSERFWYWIKQSPDQAVVTLSHQDYKNGTRLPFPFQPEWVLEALGMATYDAEATNFEVRVLARTFELSEPGKSPQGEPIRKVVILDRRRTLTPPVPRVKAYQIRDMKDQIVCEAKILETKAVNISKTESIAAVRKLSLEWPAQKMLMTMTLDSVEINNTPTPKKVADFFTVPKISGYKEVDLARVSMKR